MPGENYRTQSRRNVIKKVSLTGLASVPLLSSGAAARSGGTQKGKNGYVINENGFLEYHGPKDDPQIESAVRGMNQAKREGKAKFVIENGQVVAKSTTAQIAGCDGENGYSRTIDLRGVVHEIKLDSCKTRELIDLLIKGAAASQVAALLIGATGNIPAALAAECATVILAASHQMIKNNAEGDGVVLMIPAPATVVGAASVDVDPQ